MKVRILTSLIILSLLAGCKSKQIVTTTPDEKPEEQINTPSDPTHSENPTVIKDPPANATYAEIVGTYIDNYSEIAQYEMTQYGIPASITLAQGILESGAGRGELTRKANNHFGIKCHTSWTGDRVYHDDDEQGECFRKYRDPKTSFRDHSLFLTQRSRYRSLFSLKKDDYKGWAKGLKKAGYATDPKYPNKLISIIERYNLTQYDKAVLGDYVNLDETAVSKVDSYKVIKGDTLYSIARRFKLSVETLKDYNGLRNNTISIGQVLYLQPVKKR